MGSYIRPGELEAAAASRAAPVETDGHDDASVGQSSVHSSHSRSKTSRLFVTEQPSVSSVSSAEKFKADRSAFMDSAALDHKVSSARMAKYFGAEAKLKFYATYRDLQHQKELLPSVTSDGQKISSLKELISLSADSNPVNASINSMIQKGVIRPCTTMTAEMRSVEGDFASFSSRPGLFGGNEASFIESANDLGETSSFGDNDSLPPIHAGGAGDGGSDDEENDRETLPRITYKSVVGLPPGESVFSPAKKVAAQSEIRSAVNELVLPRAPVAFIHRPSYVDFEAFENFLQPVHARADGADSDDDLDDIAAGEDGEGFLTYGPDSPRAKFLVGCIEKKVPPRNSMILRANVTSRLFLEHQGIGDDLAVLLAKALGSMPLVTGVNLADNNLTDAGLEPVISSIMRCPLIRELDISENIIGPGAASALAALLESPDCKLNKLTLRKANVDDGECNRFVEAMKGNKYIEVSTVPVPLAC